MRPNLEQLEPRCLLSSVPQPDHVVVVVEENHSFSEIIGAPTAPYINSLAGQGALFTQSFALTHPSQPNYLYLFSGSTQGTTDDSTLAQPLTTPNLGAELIQAGRSFAGYSEDLPATGSTVGSSGDYYRKHNPWSDWQGAAGANALPSSTNLRFADFPTDYSQLPTVSFVVPNQQHDMHDGTIQQADTWLKANLDGYANWAQKHNSLLIVTFDEDDTGGNNQIATIFDGPMVVPGSYGEHIRHDNVLRTVEDMYGLAHAGDAQTAVPIQDVWQPPAAIAPSTGGGQSAAVNGAFAAPLVAFVTDGNGNPVSNVTVTFAAPGSGAGVTFTGGNTATTNGQGLASKLVTANTTAGSYNVTASVANVATPATFALTNNAVLAFSAPTYHFNEGSTATLTITLAGNPTGAVAVAYAVSQPNGLAAKYLATPGKDYTGAANGTVTFNPGVTSQTITFALPNPNLVEENTQFVVTLSQPTGAVLGSQAAATVTIVDTNLPNVANTTPALATLQAAGLGFGTSTEHYQQFVLGAYATYLNRTPSATELAYWVNLMQAYESNHAQGLRQQDIEAGFLDSKEYLSRNGGTANKTWIDSIYTNLLKRGPDSAGEAYWLAQLAAGLTAQQVALGFTASQERLTNRVTATYQTLLGRAPDTNGLTYWINIFNTGGTTEDINSGFAGSVEYYNKANGSLGGGAAGNPAKWIREAYLDVLGRAAQVAEMTYWLSFLNK